MKQDLTYKVNISKDDAKLLRKFSEGDYLDFNGCLVNKKTYDEILKAIDRVRKKYFQPTKLVVVSKKRVNESKNKVIV